ncbi:MAG: beta-lactam-binding protein with PASTA domain/predicted Ser/Thr protein kinase [Candidatus Azotimanducaceae bacterium]|jgi:beta-lactam-binding protein with PASTA domain/predicted Ser/Thr protein kinase
MDGHDFDATEAVDNSGLTGGGLVGRVLADRYRIAEVVSAGANTIIANAFDIDGNQPVTFKIVRPELAGSEEFRRDFRKQAELATALSHPNIAQVLDWGDVDIDGESALFWVVEYLSGGSLRDLLDRGRLLEPSQALVVGLEACRALDAGHQRGIAHTEVTPSKLVFGEDRRVRIVDFGMAELIGRSAWDEPATVATHVARYASPEQALRVDVGPKTDVYSLALSLLEAVTGAVPFSADSTVSTLAARVGKLMPVSADLGSLAAVLERAGRPEADDRFSAVEFGRGLVAAAETLPRPEPIPIVAATLFDTSKMRRPTDPTGGFERPASADLEADVAAAVADAESQTVDQTADEALIILPDVADPPTGAVTVASGFDRAASVAEATTQIAATAPTISSSPATEQMPITQFADAPAAATLYDDERPKRRVGAMVTLSLFVLAGLTAVAFAAFFLLRTKSYEVPELSGVDEAVALNEIAGNDWLVFTELQRSDEEPDAGQVIRTFPAAGAVLEEGDEFRIYVSEGPLFRVLPELAELPLADAQALLEAIQLTSFVDAEVFDETRSIGMVLGWRVVGAGTSLAGDQVLPGTSIALTTSKGPAPRIVPNVVGLTLEDAQAAAAAVQLSVVAGEDVFSNDVPVGIIVSQDTAAESELPRDGSFTVVRSKGLDLIALPELDGLSFTDAQNALIDAGFTIGSLLGTTEGSFESISISAEPVGDLYRRGTAVDLIFL